MPKTKAKSADIFVAVQKDFLLFGIAADLGPTASMILIAIAAHANQYGEDSYPSQKRIAELIGVTEDTVNKHLKTLLDYSIDGRPLITVRQERSETGYRKNTYTVTSPGPVGRYKNKHDKSA